MPPAPWSCDPYKKNPLVKYVWRQFRAVPVLPVQPRLDVLQVLMKCGNDYCIIGDLADVCTAGEDKEFLRKVIAERDSSYIIASEIFGPVEATGVKNHVDWSVKLVAVDIGPSVGLSNGGSLDIKVPSHQSIAVAEGKISDLLDKVSLNTDASIFRRKGKPMNDIQLYVVQEVIKVSALEVSVSDVKGAHLGAAFPAMVLPIPLDLSLRCDLCSEGQFVLRGPVRDGADQLFPVAFKGWKCVFRFGRLWHCSRAKFAYDSHHLDDLLHHEEELSQTGAGQYDHPLNDPDMGDFLENHWFASIQVARSSGSDDEGENGSLCNPHRPVPLQDTVNL